MHPPPLSAHPITPKLHLIPVLSFLWAPSLKNSWGCAAAGWKYISQHATFHSEALGYELSCSIIQNELHPDLWAHAGRWGLVLSVLMGIICFWGEQQFQSKMVWTCPTSTRFDCIYLIRISEPSQHLAVLDSLFSPSSQEGKAHFKSELWPQWGWCSLSEMASENGSQWREVYRIRGPNDDSLWKYLC